MKKLIGIGLVLVASVSVAQAVVLDVGDVVIDVGTLSVQVPVVIQGNAKLQAVEATVVLDAGIVPTGFELKSGVLSSSSAPVSDPLIDGQTIWASYAHAPGQNSPLSGGLDPLGMLTVDTSAAAVEANVGRVFSIVWNGDVFPLGITVTTDSADQTAQFAGGSITIVPEPAALALLGLGGLFLRRRSA